jgi:tetratricopeptide (TPR) repeat protein
MGELGNYYAKQYDNGNYTFIAELTDEEPNLLHARTLARQGGWWDALIYTMQGLQALYAHTGRRAKWKRLVDEIVPDLVDPATDGPRAGRERQWGLVTEYRVRLAMEDRQWAESERLQRMCVDWNRRAAAPALASLPASPSTGDRSGRPNNQIRTLAASVVQLADILREQIKPDCVAAYQEGYDLMLRIGDQPGAAVTAFNLGHAYQDIPALRDLAQAERWYQRSLELYAESDRLGRARCTGQLGLVAYERFNEARQGQRPQDEALKHINTALKYYTDALGLTPPDAVNELAIVHRQLGNIWGDAGEVERALQHCNESSPYAVA